MDTGNFQRTNLASRTAHLQPRRDLRCADRTGGGAQLLHRRDRRGQEPGHRRDRSAARPAQPGGDAPPGRRRGARQRRVRSRATPSCSRTIEQHHRRARRPPTAANCCSPAGSTPAGAARSASTAIRSRWACSSRWPSSWSTCTASTITSTCSSRRTRSTCSTSSASCWPLRQQYHDVYEKVVDAQRRIEELSANRTLREQQLELYRFQAEEIDAAELDPAEYAELEARASVLQNLEKLKKDAGAVHAALYEADGVGPRTAEDDGGDAGRTGEARPEPQAAPPTALRDATIELEEVAFDLSRYLDKLDLDPGELAEVNDRLNTINRILNKYGDPVETTLAYRAGDRPEDRRTGAGDRRLLDRSRSELAPLLKELKQLGEELSAKRQAVAKKLGAADRKAAGRAGDGEGEVHHRLRPGGRHDRRRVAARHAERVRLRSSSSPRPTPASSPSRCARSPRGGELSRIMLALKGILAQSDRISVLVFDEIDANVGGRLGSVIGNKLRRLADASPGAVHHPPAADRQLRRPPPDRPQGSRRQRDRNQGPRRWTAPTACRNWPK